MWPWGLPLLILPPAISPVPRLHASKPHHEANAALDMGRLLLPLGQPAVVLRHRLAVVLGEPVDCRRREVAFRRLVLRQERGDRRCWRSATTRRPPPRLGLVLSEAARCDAPVQLALRLELLVEPGLKEGRAVGHLAQSFMIC